MRAQKVFESINFKRGADPHAALSIGKHSIEMLKQKWEPIIGEYIEIFDENDQDTYFKRNMRWTNFDPGNYGLIEFIEDAKLTFSKIEDSVINKTFTIVISDGTSDELIEYMTIFDQQNRDFIGVLNHNDIDYIIDVIGITQFKKYVTNIGQDAIYKMNKLMPDIDWGKDNSKETLISIASHSSGEDGLGYTSYSNYGEPLYHFLNWMSTQKSTHNNGVSHTDMTKFMLMARFGQDTYDYKSRDRGYWSAGFSYYLRKGYIVKQDRQYFITKKGLEKLDKLKSKFE